jgi:hypothetical protein
VRDACRARRRFDSSILTAVPPGRCLRASP